ncbi:MAG: hypothetical protein CMF72_22805 [Mameliella sp.]|nr:hypothetical protein [Mameliella sp.]
MSKADYDPFNAREAKGNKPRAGGGRVAALSSLAEQKMAVDAARRDQLWPKPGGKVEGVGPGAWREDYALDDTGCLPDNCPVRPLGFDGEQYYLVDTSGQIFNTGTASMGVERIQKLFAGHEDFLCWCWPAFSRDGKRVTGFKAEEVRRDLYAACRARGNFSMTDMVRGRGAWRDDDGRLILHCGGYLWYDGRLQDTGEVGTHFYVRRPGSLVPWGEPVKPEDNPAVEIIKALRTWNFERGDIDSLMVLGWIGVAMMGAALEWRPSVFVVADAGSGKSQLVGKSGLLRSILGRSMVATTNASEAGLYQLVGHDSLPIAIDEMEGEDGPEQAQKIIKMARDAASGSVRIRGGADHKGVEFQAQSAFLFSAINPPPLPPASLTRLAIIQINKFKGDPGTPPELMAAETVGPRLLRRVADGWADFPRIYENYRTELRQIGGHDSRGQNTFGTFLACAHLLLGDEGLEALGLPFETLDWYAEQLRADLLPELADKKESWELFIQLLLTSPIDAIQEHGQRLTVAQVIENSYGGGEPWSDEKVARYLAAAGLGWINRRDEKLGGWLAVPNQSRVIGKMMADTPFGDRSGNGNWRFALSRGMDAGIVHKTLPAGVGGRKSEGNRVTVAGNQERCLFINLPAWRKHASGED